MTVKPYPTPRVLVFPQIIRHVELSSNNIDFEDRDRTVESPPIVHMSDNEKQEESMDFEECIRKINSLFENDFNVGQEAVVEEE
ncbi:hypothetical protein V6N13_109552 [Hibiscus sabdariffa]